MAKLKLTFEEYIKSPAGKGASMNPARDSTEAFYQTKYDALVARDGLVKYKIYKTPTAYYIHFLIPSNSTKGFTYDTVVELRQPEEGTGAIKNYHVRFYSNDPDFNFTHAHAYLTHGLIIPEFQGKLSILVKSMKAHTRNPDNTVGYVQSIYFAYLTMKKNNLFDKSVLDTNSVNGGLNKFANDIKSYDKKEEEKKKFVQQQKNEAKKPPEQRKELKPKIISSKFIGNGSPLHIPIVSKITSSTRATGSAKRSKTTKTTKKI